MFNDAYPLKEFMRRLALAGMVVAVFGICGQAWAEPQTITTHETEKVFFRDNTTEKFEGQYEMTYFFDVSTHELVRTRIYDFVTKKVKPDNTVYTVQKDLNSHPQNASKFGLPPVIRGFAQTGPDQVELIQIDGDEVYTSTSTNNSLVVARAKRLS